MEEPIEVVIERRRSGNYLAFTTSGNQISSGTGDISCESPQKAEDASRLADAFLAYLAAQSREAAERARPPTLDWIEQLGISMRPRDAAMVGTVGTITLCLVANRVMWIFPKGDNNLILATCGNRGELLDVLAGLKIPVKTQ